jgi:hypothetical protein
VNVVAPAGDGVRPGAPLGGTSRGLGPEDGREKLLTLGLGEHLLGVGSGLRTKAVEAALARGPS